MKIYPKSFWPHQSFVKSIPGHADPRPPELLRPEISAAHGRRGHGLCPPASDHDPRLHLRRIRHFSRLCMLRITYVPTCQKLLSEFCMHKFQIFANVKRWCKPQLHNHCFYPTYFNFGTMFIVSRVTICHVPILNILNDLSRFRSRDGELSKCMRER
jgi:hypothetical protein